MKNTYTYSMRRVEFFLRACAVLLLATTTCLVAFDSQYKIVLFVEKKVTFSDLNSLVALVFVAVAAAIYNIGQVMARCLSSNPCKTRPFYPFTHWFSYLLDQMTVYITFGANTVALAHCLLVITGEDELQWMKWCNRYTKFCFQIGGALASAYVACVLLAFISFISAFNLFSLYSPIKFPLRLKCK